MAYKIPPLEETSEGLRINLIQKYHCKIVNGNETKYTQLIGENLHREGKPDLQEHVNSMSPRKWMKTGAKLKTVNSVTKFLEKNEESEEDWRLAPIWRHSYTHKFFPFYPEDIAMLQAHQIVTVSQIFYTHLSGGMTNPSPQCK